MSIKTDLSIAPYFDDYDITKKYYRVLFKPGYAVQARELTQLQTTLQNQIEQFGENIYKEGSIIKGCTFTELRNLKYVKVIDGIRPEDYLERTEVNDDVTDEYYYEIEDVNGLKALIVQASSGFQSRSPDLNTFFILYLNTVTVGGFEKKEYEPNDTLSVYEYIIRTQTIDDQVTETIIDNGVVATTSVAGFSDPVGNSFGLNAAEGIIFQRGHFLFVDDQTIVVSKYMTDPADEFAIQPDQISVGYIVDETIATSQQDTSLLDNANGSPNENAPGADRLMLIPRLIALPTTTAEADSEFFILRRYENGFAVETRNVSEFNSIAKELARRTYETNGDYTKSEFQFNILKNETTDTLFVEMGEGIAYSKGYRISNDSKRIFPVPAITATTEITNQPVNFNYGGFCRVLDPTGRVTIGSLQNVSLLNESNISIGSALVKNYTEDRLYLFGVRMAANAAFEDVKYVKEGSTQGEIEISPKIINSSESRLVFDSNRSFVNAIDNISFNTRKSKVAPSVSSVITIEPASGESFDSTATQDLLVINHNDNQSAAIVSAVISGGNLVITTNSGTQNVTVYYNIRLTDPESRLKQVFDVYVKTEYSDTKSIYTLGLPDAIEVISITDSSENDFTESFRLRKNQKDDFYDHSYLEKLSGRPSPANATMLTIKVKVFKVDTSSDINFFTIDSYTSVDTKYIPYFETQDGQAYDLKSSLDFRPYRTPIASYSTTAGGATIITDDFVYPNSSTQLFTSAVTYVIPSVNTSATVDLEYYGNRVDYIVGSSYGRFRYIIGDEGSSVGKIDKNENSIIAEIVVPGYPLLSPEEASRLNRRNETIQIKRKTVKTYTMKDIDSISKKIDRLVYYATLNALETSTKNLLIQDENGLNRFKNGIVVDPFNDLSIADVTDPDFNASVDFAESALYPSVRQFPLDLRVKTNTNTQSFGNNRDVTTLTSNQLARFIKQQYATNFRTCTSNFYSYKGTGFLNPSYDVAYDTVTTPVNFEIDLATPFAQFTEALSEFVPLTSTQTNLLSTSVTTTGDTTGKTRNNTTETVQEFEDVFRAFNVSEGATREQFVGDFITNSQFRPFIRSRELSIEMYGLRPNTRHYFFFDEQDINAFVSPGTYQADLNSVSGGLPVRKSGEYGAAITANSNGELFAVFNIPENTFFVGERELIITDVSSLDNIESAAASLGKLKYNAYNFSEERAGLTISTRPPEFDVIETRSTRTVVNRETEVRRKDPLAQTFFVKDTMTQGADALYLGRVDVYFKRKGLSNGVTIMIREVVNGYPSSEILPFAKKHLRSSQVNVSDDSSVATSIFFDAPVRLDAEKEYALVVMPDAADPDYLIFTQKVGGTDLITGLPINSDWGDGVLFTSTNNMAWQSYQDEDVKFDLYRYNFNVNEGTVELETKDVEFFTVESTIGKFINNELAYMFTAAVETVYPVVLNTSTNVVTGTSLNNYVVGDYLYVENGSGLKDLLKVASVTNSTQIIVDKQPRFAGTFNSRPVVAGTVVYFNTRKPDFLALENSSARDARLFSNGGIVRGLNSDARATIVSVDNIELSYIQAMVNRITDADTNVRVSVKAIDPLNSDDPAYLKEFDFANKKAFNERGCVIFSTSNNTAKTKNLRLILTLEKSDLPTTTPVVDTETAKLFAYIYNITDDSSTSSRYISKKVELQEGFDSEDFRLYVTGYRPLGTDIKAYIKIKNDADPVSLRNNNWIELEKIQGSNLYSSISNTNDYKEFVYEIPPDQKDINGVTVYTNETGIYTGYRSFAIRIDLLSDNIANVPKLLDYRGVAFE